MRSADVRHHWERLARAHGTALDATTKTPTIKRLEIAALLRALHAAGVEGGGSVLEVGCGNGANCIALAGDLPMVQFTGVDYVPDMVENARTAVAATDLSPRVRFVVGDVLALDRQPELEDAYDIVFTDRCLINLMSVEEQLAGFDQLAAKVRRGGQLLVLENTVEAFRQQNELREAIGLPRRTPAEYNRFIEQSGLLDHAARTLDVLEVEEFAGLHDLVLYVLVPASTGGEIDYAHPLVEAATSLLLAEPSAGGVSGAGQNRLFRFRKP